MNDGNSLTSWHCCQESALRAPDCVFPNNAIPSNSMPEMLFPKIFPDTRGILTVLDRELPFSVRRVFYIYGVPNQEIVRGGHRHYKTRQVLICLSGSCIVDCDNGKTKTQYTLNEPSKVLLLEPDDFHLMHTFSANAVLMTLASQPYDPADYIHTAYT